MNTHKKGKQLERWVANLFVFLGRWKLSYVPPSAKFHNGDIYEMFDISAITPSGLQVYAQVKTNITDYYKFKKRIGVFLKKHNIEDSEISFLLIWTDKTKFRIWEHGIERTFKLQVINGALCLKEEVSL